MRKFQWWHDAEARLWQVLPDALPRPAALAVRTLRVLTVLWRDLASGSLNLHAMSLVYTTLLSLVPLLALSFSVLKAFGVHNQVRPLLSNFLAPLGPEGERVTGHIIGFVERMNVGVLGTVGLALLIYAVVSLVQKIEGSFNFIWHVSSPRGIGERFSRYLSVLMVGPLIVFVAISSTAALVDSELVQSFLEAARLGWALEALTRLMPMLMVVAAFAFLYAFIPNTRVRPVPALVAGLVGGLLWQLVGWAFASFAASSTRYSAIYSGFAILVLFMIWLYLSWLVLLLGASIAFYVQNPSYVVASPGEPRLSNRMRERLALGVMALIAAHHRRGAAAWTLPELTDRLRIPTHAIEAVLDALVAGGVLARTDLEPCTYLPARDLHAVSVGEMLALVRAAGEQGYLSPQALRLPPAAARAGERLEEQIGRALEELPVAELGEDADAAAHSAR